MSRCNPKLIGNMGVKKSQGAAQCMHFDITDQSHQGPTSSIHDSGTEASIGKSFSHMLHSLHENSSPIESSPLEKRTLLFARGVLLLPAVEPAALSLPDSSGNGVHINSHSAEGDSACSLPFTALAAVFALCARVGRSMVASTSLPQAS